MNVLGLHPRTWDADQLLERREELRERKLEPPTFDKLFTVKGLAEATEAEQEAFRKGWTENDLPKLNGYLSGFVLGLGREDGKEVEQAGGCPCCLATLGGFLTGSFEWGLVHGEGSCSACGWPVKAYHRLYLDERGDDKGRLLPEHREDDPGEPDLRFEWLLPAHPNAVLLKGEDR